MCVYTSMNRCVNFVICLFTAVCVKCVEYFGEKVGSRKFNFIIYPHIDF